MLQVKSFKMDDADGVNKLLTRYRMAPGATIMVSNGMIMVPYEDGQQESVSQRLVEISEERAKTERKVNVFEHTQLTSLKTINRVIEQINVHKEKVEGLPKDEKGNLSPETRKIQTRANKEIKRLESVVSQHEAVMVQNAAEVTTLTIEIEAYDEEIGKLDVPTGSKQG